MCLLAAATEGLFSLSVRGRADHLPTILATLGSILAGAAWALARGSRAGDLEVLALFALVSPLAAVIIRLHLGSGRVSTTALAMVLCCMIGALLLPRDWHVVVQVAVAEVVLGLVGRATPSGWERLVELGVSAFILLIVIVTLRLLRNLAVDALALARANEITDPLTGLINRRGLERVGASPWRHQAAARPLVAFLVIDVDHFKRLNDTRGHAAGDEALRRLAALLQRQLRQGDVAVRLGGEEFLILCRVEEGQAVVVAERVRAAVQAELAPMTVSVGVYETPPDPAGEVSAMWTAIGHADRALYQAKNSGRNCVVGAPQG
jgi:diguanylate cyclase (GGDEF)-like protein